MPAPEPVPVDETLTVTGPLSVPGFHWRSIPRATPAGTCPFSSTVAAACSSPATLASGGRNGQIRRSPRMITEDRAAESASVARLADLSFEAAAFGHGRSISREAARTVPRLRRARSRRQPLCC